MELKIETGDIIAFYAAIVSTMLLFWDLLKWLNRGPKIDLSTLEQRIIIKRFSTESDYIGKNHEISISNTGDKPTSVQEVCFVKYKNLVFAMLLIRWRVSTYNAEVIWSDNLDFPCRINVGDALVGTINGDNVPDAIAMSRSSRIEIIHTFGRVSKMVNL